MYHLCVETTGPVGSVLGGNQQACDRIKATKRLRGFAVSIQPYTGFTLQQVRELERRLEDYAEEPDLQLKGHHLRFAMSSLQRSLTATDHVDLVD